MRVIANRPELLALYKKAAKLASSNSPIKALEGVLMEADKETQTLRLSSTNMEISIQVTMSAEVRQSGGCVLNAKMGTEMLTLLGGDTVALVLDDKGSLLVGYNQSRFRVSVLPPQTYPPMELPYPEDTVQASGIPSMVKRTGFAASGDGVMNCIHLVFSEHGMKAVGSDGTRIMTSKGESKDGASVKMLIPARSMATLAGLVSDKDELSVGTTGKIISFMANNFIFTARLMHGNYIDTDMILSNCKSQFMVLTDGVALWKLVDSASTLAREGTTLALTFEGNRATIQCDSEYGSAQDSMDVIPLRGIPTGTYYYSAKKLMQCLKAFDGSLQLEIGTGGILLLSDETTSCFLIAMRKPKPIQLATPKNTEQAEKPKKTRKKKELPQAA